MLQVETNLRYGALQAGMFRMTHRAAAIAIRLSKGFALGAGAGVPGDALAQGPGFALHSGRAGGWVGGRAGGQGSLMRAMQGASSKTPGMLAVNACQ